MQRRRHCRFITTCRRLNVTQNIVQQQSRGVSRGHLKKMNPVWHCELNAQHWVSSAPSHCNVSFRQPLQTDCSSLPHVPLGLCWPLHGHLPGCHSNRGHADSWQILQQRHRLADGPGLQCCGLLYGVYTWMCASPTSVTELIDAQVWIDKCVCVCVCVGVCQWVVSLHINNHHPGALAHHHTRSAARP